jgi:hypothetical protein
MSYKQKNYKTVNDFYVYEQKKKGINTQEYLDLSYTEDKPKYKIVYPVEDTSNLNYKKDNLLELKWESFEGNGTTPSVFGPPMWFTFHNSANNYPVNPSPIVKERMKNVIIGIPVLLPCATCKDHATAYIESRFNELDNIVSTKDNLFNFFVDFHNYVNKRYDKKIYTYEEAKKLYDGKMKVSKLSFKEK